jgi:hypothetical protein
MKQILFLFLFSMLVFACGSKQEKDSPSESSAFSVERETFFNSLRNPDEVAERLIPDVVAFDSAMLNDPEYFYQYANDDIKAAANLGIYMSDLNYCIIVKEGDEIKNYFNAVYELSKAIGIEKGVLEFLMNRYQANMDQHDSVKLVVHHLFEQSTSKLQGTERERLAGMAMAGYQIENLHLTLSTLQALPDAPTHEQIQIQKELLQYVLDQQGKFEVIYNFVRANSDPLDPNRNPNYPFFDNALRELIVVYRNVTTTDLNINELHEKVDVIRNKIISIE